MDSVKDIKPVMKKKNSTKIRKKKTTHQKGIERRLRKWSSGANGDVMIESLLYPMRNNKQLLSFHQFQRNNKNAVGDIVVIDSKNLDHFIEHLIAIKNQT